VANPAGWMDDLLGMGITSPWAKRAMDAGRIDPSMSKEQAYKAVSDFFLESNAPKAARQMQLPMSSADAVPDIRSLIRYGTGGPGVPVQPPRTTYYTPEMQAQAMARGPESFANGPRVAQKQGELIPSPVDPRRFTMGDVPPGTGYTPEMIAEAQRRVEPTFLDSALYHTREALDEAADPFDGPILGLPGPVASPADLSRQRMYDQAAGYVEDIRNPPESRALAVFNRPGPGVPVDGPAGGSRGLVTTPQAIPWAQRAAFHARNLAEGLGGRELLVGAGVAGGSGMLLDAMDDEPAMTTGGEAELANESRPAPVVMPTQPKPEVEWAMDKADPAKEAKFTNAFKKSYEARHPDYSDLPDQKRKSVEAMMRAGIPQQRANEIVRGKYSISPAEYQLLRSAR